MKRKPVNQLIKEAMPVKPTKNWVDKLSVTDRVYLQHVVEEIIANPEVALSAVAKALIAELKIARGVTTVTHTLREMIRNAQQKA